MYPTTDLNSNNMRKSQTNDSLRQVSKVIKVYIPSQLIPTPKNTSATSKRERISHELNKIFGNPHLTEQFVR